MCASREMCGRPTPIELGAFRLVASLDLTIILPLASGGHTLVARGPLGYVIAAIVPLLTTPPARVFTFIMFKTKCREGL